MPEKQCAISLALGLNERYDHQVAIGIIKFARAHCDWRLYGSDWLFHPRRRRGEFQPDGVIARIADREALNRVRAHGVPVVDIAGSYDGADLPQAVNDDFLAGGMAGNHFLARGFQNFAYVGIDESSWSRRRAEGLRRAIHDAQGADDLSAFSVGTSWLKRDHSLAALAKWLRRLPRPCAVLAANDLIGYRVSMAAGLAELSIPRDLAVMGVDNEEVYCELSQPPLTSITCDCERIGWEAAKLLSQLLAGGRGSRQVVVRPLRVEMRESTNIVLGEDSVVRDIKNFIRANVEKGINVTDVAAAFPLSRRALEKRFKSSENRTIHDEILTTRLERSRRVLEAGGSAAAAAYRSGFATVQHFYHAFKRRYGTTPMEFAARARSGVYSSLSHIPNSIE